MIHVVFCDVDGTLVPPLSDSVSPRVRQAVLDAIDAGLTVGFATGRTTGSLRLVLDAIGLTQAWGVCNNGAALVRFDNDLPGGFQMIKETAFDPAAAVHLYSDAVPGAIIATWHDDTYLTTALFPPDELVAQRVVPLDEVIGRPTTKAVLRWPHLEADDIRARIADCGLPGGVDAVLSKFTAWLDLVPWGISKAAGVAELTASWGVDPSEVLAIGDDYNDVDLLAWAGRGVAMGGSPAPVLAVADEVTADVNHDGAALVLENLISSR